MNKSIYKEFFLIGEWVNSRQDKSVSYLRRAKIKLGEFKAVDSSIIRHTFSTSPLKPLIGIQRNLTGSKNSTSSTNFVFFGPIGKTRWPPWPLIGWDIFDFFFETTDRNSTKLDRKQDLNVLYQVCVFRADRKNKMAALVSDWLRHFRHLWNSWMELNKTWQEARPQRPLPSLCFSGRSEKQDGRPGRFFKKMAHCTQMHDMWPFGPLVFFKDLDIAWLCKHFY